MRCGAALRANTYIHDIIPLIVHNVFYSAEGSKHELFPLLFIWWVQWPLTCTHPPVLQVAVAMETTGLAWQRDLFCNKASFSALALQGRSKVFFLICYVYKGFDRYIINPLLCFKRDSSPQNWKKIFFFPPTCRAIYPSRYFWCELQSFGDKDVCLLLNIGLGIAQSFLIHWGKKKLLKLLIAFLYNVQH